MSKVIERARRVAAILSAIVLAMIAPAARAAEPYQINAILSLTGNLAFVGADQQTALKALEGYVNKNGGLSGRPIEFVIADDHSDPKTSLQLAQQLIAKNVPIILGPSSPQACAAIAPVLAQNGPVLYCVANAGHPVTGGYEFLTLFAFDPQFAVTVRYFRERGWKRVAYVTATDAGGQDAERAILAAAALPENKDITIVAREHFAAGDLSAAAQIARVKAANPDVLIAWATGSPAGTLLRGAKDAGIELPIVTSPGNLNAAFFRQYASLLPSNLYFATVPYYAGDALQNPATKAAIAVQTSALAAIGIKPDGLAIGVWDPAVLLLDALKKLGTDASATKIRDYLVNLRGWTGVNGTYDFRANPQRGLGENNVIMIRFTPGGTGVAVSKFGGGPLPGK